MEKLFPPTPCMLARYVDLVFLQPVFLHLVVVICQTFQRLAIIVLQFIWYISAG